MPFDDPCFAAYPPPSDTLRVDLYARVRTARAYTEDVWITMETGIHWAWKPWRNVELQVRLSSHTATGYYARPMVDTGSMMTALQVRSYVGLNNSDGLSVFNGGLQFGTINPPALYLVPPPPPVAWGAGELVDERAYMLAPAVAPSPNATCATQPP